MDGTPAVEVDDVALRYPSGTAALDGATLTLRRGELAALVGPSGCGKSTLLRIVAGLLEPTAGRVRVYGDVPRRARHARVPMGFLFQDATLLPWRTIEQNVGLPLELHRRPTDRGRVRELLQRVGLEEFGRAYPHELSGGMRMRAALARALVTSPALLLLDEPFGALDEITRQKLNEELLQHRQALGWTGLFVTHNVYEAVFLSERVLVMSPRPGRIVAEVAVELPYPRTPSTRALPEFARLAADVSSRLREGSEGVPCF